MIRYLFFVTAAYGFEILRPLQRAIEQRGDEVRWLLHDCAVPSALALPTLTLAQARVWQPHVLITPADWLPWFISGIKVQVFHGLARNKRAHARDDDSDHYRIRGWFDLYCTHGSEDTARFQVLAERHRHFIVRETGWPKLDPLFADGVPAARPGTLLYASTFSRGISSAPAVLPLLPRLCQDWQVTATLHPLTDVAMQSRYAAFRHPNYRYLPPGDPLLPAMAEAQVMLCDTSSAMYEFMLLDRPVVTLRTHNPGPWLMDVASPDELPHALQRAREPSPAQRLAARPRLAALHRFRDGRSSERVLAAIDELLDGQCLPAARKPLNWWRKWRVRRRLGGGR